MRKLVCSLAVFVLATGIFGRPASALTIFNDESSFSSAMTTTGFLDFETFLPTPTSPITVAGNETVFTGQGFTFSSLATPAPPPADPSQLYVEAPGFIPSAIGNFLSPGARPFAGGDGDNDSIQVDLTGGVNAFGFQFIDGALNPFGGTTESIQVFGASGLLYTETTSGLTYFGILADEAITQIIITEATNDGDDVGYDNFRIGTSEIVSIHAPPFGIVVSLTLLLLSHAVRRRV